MITHHWQPASEAAQRYQSVLVPAIFGPAAEALVGRVGVRAGETVVDVGCGTGAAARAAAARAGPAGRAVGVDVNAWMIDVARSLPAVGGAAPHWYEDSAYALPLADNSADVVLFAQSLQYLAEPRAALAEARRVLRPGGRAAAGAWAALADNPYYHALVEAVSRHVGAGAAAALLAGFGLSDPAALPAHLAAAQFRDAAVEPVALELPLPDPAEFVPRHLVATRMAAAFRAAPPGALEAVGREVASRLGAFRSAGGVRVPFRMLAAVGVK